MVRFLCIQEGCGHCREYLEVIQLFNTFLSPRKRIEIIDLTNIDKYGIELYPILKNVEIDGVPFLYVDGTIRVGAISKEDVYEYLKGLFSTLGDIQFD